MVSMLPTLSEQFNNASLTGNYAICCVPEGGHAESALIGVLTFDGNGHFFGSMMTNLPGNRFGERVQVDAPLKGPTRSTTTGRGWFARGHENDRG